MQLEKAKPASATLPVSATSNSAQQGARFVNNYYADTFGRLKWPTFAATGAALVGKALTYPPLICADTNRTSGMAITAVDKPDLAWLQDVFTRGCVGNCSGATVEQLPDFPGGAIGHSMHFDLESSGVNNTLIDCVYRAAIEVADRRIGNDPIVVPDRSGSVTLTQTLLFAALAGVAVGTASFVYRRWIVPAWNRHTSGGVYSELPDTSAKV